MSDSTPMMDQYLGIKEQHRDAVLFFRLGDFYEMFNEDAIEVSRLLNLTLTQRAGKPMCGIPYHASKVYIARLLRSGKKIAVCEQLSIPGPGKGLADRKVVEVITPGTVVEEDYLDKSVNNYLAALSVSPDGKSFGFSFMDVSTGEFSATAFPASQAGDRFGKELGRVRPTEILVQQSVLSSFPEIAAIIGEYPSLVTNTFPDWSLSAGSAYRRLCSLFGTESLAAFSLDQDSPEVPPAGLLLDYLARTAGSAIAHVNGIHVYTESEFVSLDDSTRKNLELEINLRDNTPSFTLFEVLDHTRTAMGSRLLRQWIQRPLVNVSTIERRLEGVEFLYRRQKLLARLRGFLSTILDVERLAGRVAMDRAHGKDLVALRQSLESYLDLTETLVSQAQSAGELQSSGSWSSGVSTDIETVRGLALLIKRAIMDDCPIPTNEGGIIRPGYSDRLDELRALRDNSNAVLEEYLGEERIRTGIQNLKIRYNRMLGYYLEVSKGNLSSVPPHFIRRRSLANGDRYTTDRLVELETELNGVQAHIVELEAKLFFDVRRRMAESLDTLKAVARDVAAIDALQSFAHAAAINAWNRPTFSDTGVMDISDGRHPVVEAHVPSGEFVPNSIRLSSAKEPGIPSFAMITGPNMAGKSTFLRQTALIVLMAQIGSFVPAAAALLTPVDRIFCRVGASDNLARGESTFLVEMTETAYILRSATPRSLVIMDEVGRGTSTEDGLSLATAITEFLLDSIGAKTLFATHYHELSHVRRECLENFCLDVLETEGTVVFLKKLKKGASANSYGLHVARLAGVPEAVIRRAGEILDNLNRIKQVRPDSDAQHEPVAVSASPPTAPCAPQLFSEEEYVLDELLSVDIGGMTPLEALAKIDAWKRRLYPRRYGQ